MKCFECSRWVAVALLTAQSLIIVAILHLSTHSKTPLTINNIPRSLNDTSLLTFDGPLGIDRFPDLTQLYPVQRLSAPHLPRALKAELYEKLMLLLSLTVKVLEEHHVDYVLAYGSLLGSYVMHDLLPWDDDIDIFIHNDSKAKVMDIFRKTDHYDITSHYHIQTSAKIVKLFFNHSNHAGKYAWKYPYLDVLTYVEQGDKISPVEKAKSSQFTIPKSSFYPFHKRPFGSMWVNAPHDPTVFFRAKYHSFACQTGTWNHEKETGRKTVTSACEKLAPYYPFVKREKLGDITAETLMFNGKAKYTVLVDEPCNTKKAMYGF